MRATFAILSLPLLSLAACGGGADSGTLSLGSIAPPLTTTTPTPTSAPTSFLDVSTTTTFDAIGGMHSLNVDATGASLYQGNASTVATPSGTISYSPRDGIFTVTLADAKAGVTHTANYQDPAHRTTNTQLEVPQFSTFNYLEAAAATNSADTFFYERPGNVASYVTLAGFVHRTTTDPTTGAFTSEHGVLAFGSKTSLLQVPTTGAGHFDGDFLATMITGGTSGSSINSPLQWLSGSSSTDVDFGKLTVALALSGTVSKTYVNDVAVNDFATGIPTGATFTANGTATLSALRSGFTGKFLSAYFTAGGVKTIVDFSAISAGSNTAGASSIDGTFYGPNAVNVGGSFRITGGVPDQRVDILGAFVGAKK